ncbi:MAG: hypothetical protein JST19_00195 [Bacteroidetes bacterium]|nr:hypothetical protein [Bacteroidota bacterium]
MTFEEFFRKKKIDLAALGKAEPALFAEFQTHFEQMGEKSFDHTKKYWFNKLRLRYHLAPEAKEEKVVIENKLAEQTITDTLSETAAPTPNVGFKPRFKAGMAKPAGPKEGTPATEPKDPAETSAAPAPAPKPGFTPRFKAGVTKPAEPASEKKEEPAAQPAPTVSKPGFTPRFKAGVTKSAEPVPEPDEPKAEPPSESPSEGKSADDTATKPAYKPRFNMKNIKPRGEE